MTRVESIVCELGNFAHEDRASETVPIAMT